MCHRPKWRQRWWSARPRCWRLRPGLERRHCVARRSRRFQCRQTTRRLGPAPWSWVPEEPPGPQATVLALVVVACHPPAPAAYVFGLATVTGSGSGCWFATRYRLGCHLGCHLGFRRDCFRDFRSAAGADCWVRGAIATGIGIWCSSTTSRQGRARRRRRPKIRRHRRTHRPWRRIETVPPAPPPTGHCGRQCDAKRRLTIRGCQTRLPCPPSKLPPPPPGPGSGERCKRRRRREGQGGRSQRQVR